MKRKLNQYSHLALAAKTQKQMLEERNANWEKALLLMGQWIIRKHDTGKQAQGIGEIVGTALELIGGHLVEDEFSQQPQTAAPSATEAGTIAETEQPTPVIPVTTTPATEEECLT